MSRLYDLFICYDPIDQSAAKQLAVDLAQTGLSVKLIAAVEGDADAPPTAPLVQAHCLVVLLTPTALKLPTYRRLLQEALAYHKCLRPVALDAALNREAWLADEPASQGLLAGLQRALAEPEWIYWFDLDACESVVNALRHHYERHRAYVQAHTQYLLQALEWTQQHRQSNGLLPGEACQQAEAWLTTRFPDEIPPCTPSDLHCEFITESLKAANQGWTQVFLAHTAADFGIAMLIRHSLIRAGMTVWLPPHRQSADPAARLQGLQQADNLVFLVSAAALADPLAQTSLEQAQQYHKRIVPILVEPLPQESLPPPLQGLPYIDLTDNLMATDYRQDESELIQTLRQDATYYEWHKRILVKALAWDAQAHPKSQLLFGGEFAVAQDWLQQANRMPPPQAPTELHRTYSAASEAMNRFYDGFISYGRIDSKAFATELHRRLTALGYRIWFDQNDIPLAVDFQEQIKDGIEKAHNFFFVISPHAVNSPYCAKELSLAVQYHKRIIPLMHVEEISEATWQQRFPTGTPEDWQAFSAAGKHSSYVNMSSDVSRLNWVFFREQLDDFEQSLSSLQAILKRHQDYVHQHTLLLTQALSWERHQRQTTYLLVGQALKEADIWLKYRFETEQAPCEPTTLQAEYICESRKYADDWMTQVFIVYAPEDDAFQRRLRLQLVMQGITVWSGDGTLGSSSPLQTTTEQGLEKADNVLVLLSSQTLQSLACQKLIAHALLLNKRVIPLQATSSQATANRRSGQPLSRSSLFALISDQEQSEQSARDTLHNLITASGLNQLQTIDLSQEENPLAYQQNLDILLQQLNTDAAFYRDHKELLVRSLKWERQERNPCILLRGASLRYYKTWWQLASQRQEHPPSPIQTALLEASEQLPPELTLDVFLACTPTDLDLGRKLNETLQIQGKTTWFPFEAGLAVEASQADVLAGLERSENVLFLISPAWLKDADCQAAFNYAQRLNKRVIPLYYQNVIRSQLPPALANLRGVDFSGHSGDFFNQFGQLYRLLESDPEHLQGHTRLLVKAQEWDQAGQDDSFLLRGRDLTASVDWLTAAADKQPQPTDLQRRYIAASQALPYRRISRRSVLWSSAVVTALVLLVRLLGGLQAWELLAYDLLMRLKPLEPLDERFLLVTVDNSSNSWLREQMKQGRYTPGIGTIPDDALAAALDRLLAAKPALVGIDFYRDFQANDALTAQLTRSDKVIGLCKAASEALAGAEKPPELPLSQVGFNDFASDNNSNMVRRHYLLKDPDPTFCDVREAFSLKLAQRYLAAQGVDYTDPEENPTGPDMRLGTVLVPQIWVSGLLSAHSGGYSTRDRNRFAGYQSLINFRRVENRVTGEPPPFAPTVSLENVLKGAVPQAAIANRIVLIGYTDLTDRNADYWHTPLGAMPGVYLQGQMASQLISAALDDRPLLWWGTPWSDGLWIFAWSTVGGLLVWRLVRPRWLGVASLGGGLLLGSVCYGALAFAAAWVPLVPSLLAAAGTGSVVAYLTYRVRHP